MADAESLPQIQERIAIEAPKEIMEEVVGAWLRTQSPESRRESLRMLQLCDRRIMNAAAMHITSISWDNHAVPELALPINLLNRCMRLSRIMSPSALLGLEGIPVSIKCIAVNGSLISTLQPLAACKLLERLHVWDAALLSNLSPLHGLTNLRSLKIEGSLRITDISPISSMVSLEELWITKPVRRNQYDDSVLADSIKSIAPLAGLKQLKVLCLFGNDEIGDLSPHLGSLLHQLYPLHTATRRYLTHENGGRPFLVSYDEGSSMFWVERNPGGGGGGNDDANRATLEAAGRSPATIPMQDVHSRFMSLVIPPSSYLKVWMGFSQVNSVTRWSGSHGPEFDGNTMLFQISPRTYVFIGGNIMEFTTPSDDSIISFSSPVGNNDVPYPFAVGARNTYLLLERVFVSNKTLSALEAAAPPPEFEGDAIDPYSLVWRANLDGCEENKMRVGCALRVVCKTLL